MVGKRLRSEQDLNLRINLGSISSQHGTRGGETDRRRILHCRDVGLVWAIDPLQVRDHAASFDNDELTPPSKPSGGLDGSVDVAVSVPVTGDEIHVLADHDPTIVHLDRATGDIETFLDVDITRVCEGLVVRDQSV